MNKTTQMKDVNSVRYHTNPSKNRGKTTRNSKHFILRKCTKIASRKRTKTEEVKHDKIQEKYEEKDSLRERNTELHSRSKSERNKRITSRSF